jgi:coenzyme F420-0:L-glutamate ligase/coenzyme F420-1:gamma-L-glutamate ligase
MSTPRIELIGITGLPEIKPGVRLGQLIATAATSQKTPLHDGDVLVVAQKVVSKAEDRFVDLRTVTPSSLAVQLAKAGVKDARAMEVALRESKSIVRMDMARGILISETHHGFVCANAGVDASNVPGEDTVLLLPENPDASAERIASEVRAASGVGHVAVIVSDTFGRPFREGHTDVAIGVAGLEPMVDYRGTRDSFGKTLKVTQMALADELAGAAEMVMGKTTRVPAVIVRGLRLKPGTGKATGLLRHRDLDLFR